MRLAILQLVQEFGVDNIGMFTFTFPSDLTPAEAESAWNSFNVNVLSKRYPGGKWVKVLELTKRGRPHFHWVGVVPGIRVGVTVVSVPNGKYKSGPDRGKVKRRLLAVAPNGSTLAQERFFMAGVLPHYGFGRFNDISPILSTAEGAANYAAKYVSKAFANRPPALRGKRLVSFGGGVKPGTSRFSSVGGKAGEFRLGLSLLCSEQGCTWEDLPDLAEQWFGDIPKFKKSSWAWWLRREIAYRLQDFKDAQPF